MSNPATTIKGLVGSVAVGSPAASQVTALSFSAESGIMVQADYANTVSIFIGDSGVVDGTGIELKAGDTCFLPLNNPSQLYCVTSIGGQLIRGIIV